MVVRGRETMSRAGLVERSNWRIVSKRPSHRCHSYSVLFLQVLTDMYEVDAGSPPSSQRPLLPVHVVPGPCPPLPFAARTTSPSFTSRSTLPSRRHKYLSSLFSSFSSSPRPHTILVHRSPEHNNDVTFLDLRPAYEHVFHSVTFK